MSPQAKRLKQVLKRLGIAPIGGVNTQSSIVKAKDTGETYREYGKASTIARLSEDQIQLLKDNKVIFNKVGNLYIIWS